MRYYDIVITDDTGALVKVYGSSAGDTPIAGALQIELDIPGTYFTAPISQAMIRIHGIPQADISQASNLNRKQCKVFAGMKKGLPLANPAQAGLICQGMIFQSFGNWIGTDMTLTLIITADGGTAQDPKNLVFAWPATLPLSGAITQSLTTAFPDFTAPSVQISAGLVKSETVTGVYGSLAQFAGAMRDLSKSILTDATYSGVQMVYANNQIVVFDSTAPAAIVGGSTAAAPRAIDFFDLIGQPTWFDFNQIGFSCVMRSDLNVGDFVKLPPGPVTQLASSQPQARDSTAFQGVFQLDLVRHVGSFRSPDASSWVSTYQAHLTT